MSNDVMERLRRWIARPEGKRHPPGGELPAYFRIRDSRGRSR